MADVISSPNGDVSIFMSRELGRGGESVVWYGRKTSGEEVAVKTLSAFRKNHEVEVLARIPSHPNVRERTFHDCFRWKTRGVVRVVRARA